jgi:hypothetical protein
MGAGRRAGEVAAPIDLRPRASELGSDQYPRVDSP